MGQGMTTNENLLVCLNEELAEVAAECLRAHTRISKALRFGPGEVQEGQPLDNARRIVDELRDVLALAIWLRKNGVIPDYGNGSVPEKWVKLAHHLRLSRECGT